MRISAEPDRLVVRDTPGCVWALALMFVASGTLVTTGAFLGFDPGDAQPAWARGVMLLIGVAHLGGGLWFLRTTPATLLVADRARGTLALRVRGLRRADYEVFRLADLRAVEVLEEKDSDGDPTFTLRLWLADGRVIPLHSVPGRDRASCERAAGTLRGFF
ncbi:MAG TPA: hypothetical protein VFQ39_06405, partial [Longimicrobium sp.]|nr:hypothetical protein [Longimicrobium sp.]